MVAGLEVTTSKKWLDVVILFEVLSLFIGTERILVAAWTSISVFLTRSNYLWFIMLLLDQINGLNPLIRSKLLLYGHWRLRDPVYLRHIIFLSVFRPCTIRALQHDFRCLKVFSFFDKYHLCRRWGHITYFRVSLGRDCSFSWFNIVWIRRPGIHHCKLRWSFLTVWHIADLIV